MHAPTRTKALPAAYVAYLSAPEEEGKRLKPFERTWRCDIVGGGSELAHGFGGGGWMTGEGLGGGGDGGDGGGGGGGCGRGGGEGPGGWGGCGDGAGGGRSGGCRFSCNGRRASSVSM